MPGNDCISSKYNKLEKRSDAKFVENAITFSSNRFSRDKKLTGKDFDLLGELIEVLTILVSN